eukprot:148285-Prymnesium_polylepis.1
MGTDIFRKCFASTRDIPDGSGVFRVVLVSKGGVEKKVKKVLGEMISHCMNRRALLLSEGDGWRGCKWYRAPHACPMHVVSLAAPSTAPHPTRVGVACEEARPGTL